MIIYGLICRCWLMFILLSYSVAEAFEGDLVSPLLFFLVLKIICGMLTILFFFFFFIGGC